MFNMHVALIGREEGGLLEVFPTVPSLSLQGFHAEDADQRSLEDWKKTVLHYAAMEQWSGVYFVKVTEQCYRRRDSFPIESFPGDANFAIFPVKEEV